MARKLEPLDIYLKQIGKIPTLSRAEEREVARLARSGDEAALKKMIEANLRFVVSFVKNYRWSNATLEDLISLGNMGLIKAAGRFDERMGNKLISYAARWIKSKLYRDTNRYARSVATPTKRADLVNKVKKAENKLAHLLSRYPSPEEIVRFMPDEAPERVRKALGFGKADVPFEEETLNAEGALAVSDGQGGEAHDGNWLGEEIRKLIATLKPKEAFVINLYFGIDGYEEKTLEEIGAELNVTRERARQIKEEALQRLRKRGGHLREFL